MLSAIIKTVPLCGVQVVGIMFILLIKFLLWNFNDYYIHEKYPQFDFNLNYFHLRVFLISVLNYILLC
jgi:hypothetical protein